MPGALSNLICPFLLKECKVAEFENDLKFLKMVFIDEVREQKLHKLAKHVKAEIARDLRRSNSFWQSMSRQEQKQEMASL